MYKIFIVEDDGGIAGAIKKEAISWGFDARTAKTSQILSQNFQNILLSLYCLIYLCRFITAITGVKRYVLYQACLLSSYPPRRTT